MMDDLTPVLSRLPEPMPPSTLTATVMARIEREAERKANAAEAMPARSYRDRAAWLWTFAGVALVLGVSIYGWRLTESLPDFTSPRVGLSRQGLLPIEGPFSLLLGVGLLIYLAGLFAPLRSGRRD